MKLRFNARLSMILLISPQLGAATNAPLQMGPAGDYLLKSMLVLAALLGMLFIALKVLRRMGHLKTTSGNRLRVIEGISLGGQERAVLLQVGDEELLVGVSQGRVTPLLSLNGLTDSSPAGLGGRAGPDFERLLQSEAGVS